MSTFYSKAQMDVLAEVIGTRIKNSVTDVRIANELQKSTQHSLLTKEEKTKIEALIASNNTSVPGGNCTSSTDILSFIDALDNGFVPGSPVVTNPQRPVRPVRPPVIPQEPTGPSTLKFTTDSKSDVLGEVPLNIQMNNVSPEWEILKNGVSYANQDTAFEAPGIQFDYGYLSINTEGSDAFNSYEFIGSAEDLSFEYSSGPMSPPMQQTFALEKELPPEEPMEEPMEEPVDIPTPTVSLESFSSEIKNIKFYMSGVDLKVPNSLPNIVTSTAEMFKNCELFNSDISSWDLSRVTDINAMFSGAESFNQDISAWDVSRVEDMSFLFERAYAFNQPLNSWDVSNVDNMYSTFKNASSFNQPLNLWDVSNVRDMDELFSGTPFNQNISDWDVSNVEYMSGMFGFTMNQDLSFWCVPNFDEEPSDFYPLDGAWTLPKPVWGTCPRKENIPFRDIINVPTAQLKPTIIPEAIITNVFSFKTENYLNDAEALPIDLELHFVGGSETAYEPRSPWVLKENGTPIAGLNADDTLVEGPEGVGIDSFTASNWINLSIQTSNSGSNTYTLEGDFDAIRLMYKEPQVDGGEDGPAMFRVLDSQADSSVVPGSIEVLNFASTISRFYFTSKFADLKVPDQLAPHITSTESMFYECRTFNQDIVAWDVSKVTDFNFMFGECKAFNQPVGTWDISSATDLSYMFGYCDNFNQYLNDWDTSNVTKIEGIFSGATEFNSPLNNWVLDNVTSTSSMFDGATNFDQDISSWNLSNVTDTGYMFRAATFFNQDISGWNVGNVAIIKYMFQSAKLFNQDLSNWCVHGAQDPNSYSGFDLETNSWTLPKPVWGTCPRGETPKPRSPNFKFVATDNTGWTGYSKEKLNIQFYGSNGRWKLIRDGITLVQNVSGYRKTSELEMTTSSGGMVTINLFSFGGDFEIVTDVVSRVSLYRGGNTNSETDALSIEVTDFSKQAERHTFELPSVHLTVPQELPRNITSTYEMFKNCTKFNSDISGWDTSRVTDMTSMFDNCHIFNQPIGSWNTSKVETLSSTFREARSFNQDISLWDVSKVYSFELTFYAATAFNQDLSQWCVTNHPSVEEGRINGFDLDTTSWTLPRPVWGTCPRGEDNPAV